MSKKKKCFVVGPIGAHDTASRIHADWLLDGIINPVFSQHFADFAVKRSDRVPTPGMIDTQMINMLLDYDLVIADMSELNPNVFYEMGIRHMAQKPIVHMFLEGTKIPFDVSPHRAIPFNLQRYADLEAAKNSLRDAVDEVLAPDFVIENPVTRARGTLQLKESATPAMQLVLERIDGLDSEISRLKHVSGRTFLVAPKPVGRSVVTFDHIFTEGEIYNESKDLAAIVDGRIGSFLPASIEIQGNSLEVRFNRHLSNEELSRMISSLREVGFYNFDLKNF